MSSFGNCKNCGKVIDYDFIPLCKECEEKFFIKVRDYIYDNGMMPIDKICEETHVPLVVINYFIDNGSLYEIDNGNNQDNSKINLDNKRKLELLNELKSTMVVENKEGKVIKKPKSSTSSQSASMRFIGKDNIRRR